MTCIVYRDGIMAADSRAYGGDKVPIGYKQKIKRLEDGTLIGVSSTVVGASSALIDWWKAGHKNENDWFDKLPEKFTLLAVTPNGEGFMACNTLLITGPLQANYFAIGSGKEYALGAMAYSELCNAIAAVAAACKLDTWSDLPIYYATHENVDLPKMIVDISPEQLIKVE